MSSDLFEKDQVTFSTEDSILIGLRSLFVNRYKISYSYHINMQFSYDIISGENIQTPNYIDSNDFGSELI